MGAATIAKLLEFQSLRRGLLVFGRRVIAAFAFGTFKRNNLSHGCPGFTP
jgi:hypothetical protein